MPLATQLRILVYSDYLSSLIDPWVVRYLFVMAANYWESTQRRNWQFTREQLEDLRQKLEDEEQNLVQMYPLPQLRHLSIYFNQRKTNSAARSTCRLDTDYVPLQRLPGWENA
jgi:deoxyribodipyrimidine photolyase